MIYSEEEAKEIIVMIHAEEDAKDVIVMTSEEDVIVMISEEDAKYHAVETTTSQMEMIGG